jgi:hypothetical protein
MRTDLVAARRGNGEKSYQWEDVLCAVLGYRFVSKEEVD